MTTGYISGRIIQTSRDVTLPVRCTWVATGNGLSMSDEIARRSYLIELETDVERPEDRKRLSKKCRYFPWFRRRCGPMALRHGSSPPG